MVDCVVGFDLNDGLLIWVIVMFFGVGCYVFLLFNYYFEWLGLCDWVFVEVYWGCYLVFVVVLSCLFLVLLGFFGMGMGECLIMFDEVVSCIFEVFVC